MRAKTALKRLFNLGWDNMNRCYALDILFGVNGTGLEWKNGEIKDLYPNNYLNNKGPKWATVRSVKREYSPGYLKILGKTAAQFAKEENDKKRKALKDIPKTIKLTPKRAFYPICKYAPISNIPDNAKTEWLKLAKEYCQLLIKYDTGMYFSPGNTEEENRVAQKALDENKRIARKMLQKIKKMLKERTK